MNNNEFENNDLSENNSYNLNPDSNDLNNEEANFNTSDDYMSSENANERVSVQDDVAEKQRRTIINLFKFALFLISIFIIISFKSEIAVFINKVSRPHISVSSLKANDYYKEVDYDFVQITDKFEITDHQHLLNAYYTALNSGATTFTMKCGEKYDDCLDDVKALSEDKHILSIINSFVHPYNSFESFETKYDTFGKITLTISKSYSKEKIQAVEEKLRDIIANVAKPNLSHKENIKLIHDYIINNTVYDKERSDERNTENKYASDIAYGPLIEGFAICGGYTDAMALFLDYYNIKNYKVISENHIWNALELDGKWLHLDLTWDDPVMSDGSDRLEHTYFLIDYEKLLEVQEDQHYFDKEVFSEAAK